MNSQDETVLYLRKHIGELYDMIRKDPDRNDLKDVLKDLNKSENLIVDIIRDGKIEGYLFDEVGDGSLMDSRCFCYNCINWDHREDSFCKKCKERKACFTWYQVNDLVRDCAPQKYFENVKNYEI